MSFEFTLPEVVQWKYLYALAILIAFVVFAKVVDLFFEKILLRITARTKIEIDEKIVNALRKPVFQTLMIVGASAAITYIALPERVDFYFQGFLSTLLVFIWGIFVLRTGSALIKGLWERVSDVTGLGKELLPLFNNIFRVITVAIALMIVLSIWEVDITPLLASAGIVGLAVAFAAKDTISNFFGGITIFMDRPYKLGDYIVLDTGERGMVVDIGIRSTKIKTRDDILISIPNAVIANAKITNESAPVPKFRIRTSVGVAYGTDVKKVEEVLLKIAEETPGVSKEPMPRVRFRRFGDSSLDFELLCWINHPRLKGRVLHSLNSEIYKTFNREGIVIPFPQRDIYIHDSKV